ncbi:hypothetical protein SCLCIDRAFT_1221229 [Scleroderma citrinum Foug A]|uniref:DUF6534 domain-containing protein n=1 Tax=Scleroderma citrinum Foug A TaxID=1036808 RepID=A0A0C3DG89_9AGAM|nr:hypothetical protein SCLCIDRAFT_1221229 [Scleroderma citrinum Foug A]
MNPAEIAHGPFFIGVAINILLYGIMITQMYLYYSTYKRDHVWVRFFVAFLFLADTVNTLFDFVYIYQSLVNHFGDSQWLATANWVFATDPFMTGFISGSVQLFFAWRIYVLTKNRLVVSAVVLLSVASFLGSVGTTVGTLMTPAFVQFQKFEVIVIIWLACAACADVIIATALVLHLRSHKSGIPATDDVIDRVIRLTMQTGLVTSLWATVNLVLYLTISSGLHLLFNVPLAKLYTNSLMSSLNARGGWNRVLSSDQVCDPKYSFGIW